jgi:CRISPR-associated protein Csd1
LLDTVVGMFRPGDFTSDGRLTGEFLLGYHCQRAALWEKGGTGTGSIEEAELTEGDGKE